MRMWICGVCLVVLPACGQAAAFQADSLVVLRVGDGVSALGAAAAPAFLDEYSMDGVVYQSMLLPVTESGNAFVEGQLSLSGDGRALAVPGYGGAPGSGTAGNSTVARQVVLIDSTGQASPLPVTVLGSRVYTAAAAEDGNGAYLGGSQGVAYVDPAGMSLKLTSTRAFDLGVAGEQLYFSTDGGIYALGSGLPTSGLPMPALVAPLSDPRGISLFDLSDEIPGVDTLYAVNLSSGTTGLHKFNKQYGGTWTHTGYLGADIRSLDGRAQADGVRLIGVDGGGRRLQSWLDTGGWGAMGAGAFSTVATAPARTSFLGASMAPAAVPEPGSWALAVAGIVCCAVTRRRI